MSLPNWTTDTPTRGGHFLMRQQASEPDNVWVELQSGISMVVRVLGKEGLPPRACTDFPEGTEWSSALGD